MRLSDDLRVGKFFIDINRYTVDELFELMNNFLIFKAEYNMFKKMMEYHAISPLFTEIKRGEDLPLYKLHVDRHEVYVKQEKQ